MRNLSGIVSCVAPTLALAALMLLVPATSHAQVYTANLSGPAESPANASPGTGFATVSINPLANTMRVQVIFSALTGVTTASHIHSATAVPGTGTAGVATQTPTFSGFPLGVTSGSYDNTFDMTLAASYNPAFVTANGGTVDSARAALFSGIASGSAYLNIHTSTFGGGEIRGFLAPATVPETGTLGLLAASVLPLGGMLVLQRRRTQKETARRA